MTREEAESTYREMLQSRKVGDGKGYYMVIPPAVWGCLRGLCT